MFKKILIANRGEIAVRVAKACREMGISSVAVYSEADRSSLHVQLADEAVFIGPAPAVDSYLAMERIVRAAQEVGAEAIHPGYGFLAENADFARLCEKEGVVFIGPNSAALELVGDKVRARQTMEKAGIPITPGLKTIPKDQAEFNRAARTLGYPVIVKASAGAAGKGCASSTRKKTSAPPSKPDGARPSRPSAMKRFISKNTSTAPPRRIPGPGG